MISRDELIEDLHAVADGDKAPTKKKYDEEGEYTANTIARRLGSGSWNEAVRAVGLGINEVHAHRDQDVLRALRERTDTETAPSQSEVADTGDHCPKTYANRYGSYWKGTVAAGLKPQTKRPLDRSEYAKFVEEARNLPLPSQRVVCLLRAFTGLGRYLLRDFSLDWICYIDSDRRSTLLKVPSRHLPTGKDWNIKIPTRWHNPATQENESTELEGLLKWCIKHGCNDLYSGTGTKHLTDRVHQKIGVGRNYADLKMSLGTHLAEREAEPWFIENQTGINITNAEIDVTYFFLWNHVHRGVEHPDYDPPDVVLDPV